MYNTLHDIGGEAVKCIRLLNDQFILIVVANPCPVTAINETIKCSACSDHKLDSLK